MSSCNIILVYLISSKYLVMPSIISDILYISCYIILVYLLIPSNAKIRPLLPSEHCRVDAHWDDDDPARSVPFGASLTPLNVNSNNLNSNNNSNLNSNLNHFNGKSASRRAGLRYSEPKALLSLQPPVFGQQGTAVLSVTEQRVYAFDHVFGPEQSQVTIYRSINIICYIITSILIPVCIYKLFVYIDI
jgi:hypothetical protein